MSNRRKLKNQPDSSDKKMFLVCRKTKLSERAKKVFAKFISPPKKTFEVVPFANFIITRADFMTNKTSQNKGITFPYIVDSNVTFGVGSRPEKSVSFSR